MKEDWIECKLSEIFRTITGITPSKKDIANYGNEIPFIKPPDITNGPIQSASEYLSLKGRKIGRVAPKFSILITCIGNLGRIGFNKEEVAFNQQINAILPVKEIDYMFIFYQAQSMNFKNQLEGLSTSTTVALVNKSNFNSIKVYIAPLPIQRAIVLKIENLFVSLDKGIADLKTAREQLKIYRQAVLKKAFSGEYTREWRKYNENESWSNETFDSVTNSLKRGPFGGDLKKKYFVKRGFPVYEQQHAINNNFENIRYFINEERYHYLKACEALPGDYIVSCSGTIGRIARIPFNAEKGVINQALMRVRIDENKIIHKYFYEFFKSQFFQRLILQDSRGSGMQNIAGIKELKPIRIKLPPISEQNQIVREIESRLSVCDKLEQSISEALEKAEALRQSILKKAFNGKLLSEAEIVKCKREADYEPASVLLERIKKEKQNETTS